MVRQRVLCTAAASVAFLLAPAGVAAACSGEDRAPTRTTLDRAESATVCVINEVRADRGLGRLTVSAALARAASSHSRDMVARDFFSHQSPGGSTPTQRIERSGYLDGASRWAIGETLGWGRGSSATPEAIVRSWLRSPGHRSILLDRRFEAVGIGIALGTPAGEGATFTADFGSRG